MHIRRNHDIGTPGFQPLPGTGKHFGGKGQLSGGFLCQFVHQREQRGRRDQRLTDDGQMRLPASCQCFRITGQFIRRFQQQAAALQQHPPDISEFCPVTRAVKQNNIQLFFQFLHGIAQGGRYTPQFFRRRRKTSPAVDGIHHAQ